MYGKYECFVMQMLYVRVLCARGILQSRSHDCLIGSHECPSIYPHPVAVILPFVVVCTEM